MHLTGAFDTIGEYADRVTSTFNSCRNLEDLETQKADFIDNLRLISSRYGGEIKDDQIKAYKLFDKSISEDPDQNVPMQMSIATHLNRLRMEDGKILDERIRLVEDLYENRKVMMEFNIDESRISLDTFEALISVTGDLDILHGILDDPVFN